MWAITVIAASCLLVSPSLAGVKDLASHFMVPEPEPEPRGMAPGAALDLEAIPLDFHRENTITNDLPLEGYEDEDYIDFDKILAGDDYR